VEKKSIPPVKIHFSADDRAWILSKIDQTLARGSLSLGPVTQEFETTFAAYCGTKHAVAVSSGTAALEIIFRGLSLPGHEVLIPTNTFFATPAAAVHAGLRVKFIDMDPTFLAPTPEMIEAAITPATKAVVIVHIGGHITPHMPAIQALCKKRSLYLIEDAAHAHGSSLDGKLAGSFSDAAAFSFYPTKVITSGEGGMILTDNEGLANEARLFRDQGKEGPTTNRHSRLGYNWRMSDVHAAIGLRHLASLPAFIQERHQLAARYDELLAGSQALSIVNPATNCSSNFYKFVVMPRSASMARADMKQKLLETFSVRLPGEVYELPCHLQPVFMNNESCAPIETPMKNAEAFCRTHLCLPIYPGLSSDDQRYVVQALEAVLGA